MTEVPRVGGHDEFLAEQWPRPPAPVHIYRVDPVVEPLDDLAEVAGLAGMSCAAAQEWREDGPRLELHEPPRTLTVYRPSRALRYVDASRWQVDDGTSTVEVSDEDAFAAAGREAARLCLAAGDRFAPGRVSRLFAAAGPRVVDVGVTLVREIDGLPVEGRGGIVVNLGPDLRTTGFERVARRVAGVYEPVRAWRPMAAVLAEVEEHWGRPGIAVTGVRLAYVEFGCLAAQEFIQPAYVLSVRLPTANGAVRTVEHVAVAAVNGVGTLMAATGEPAAVPRE